VHHLVLNVDEDLFGYFPSLMDGVDHVTFDQLEPFMSNFLLPFCFLYKLVPYLTGLVLRAQFFILHSHKIKQPFDIPITFLRSTNVPNHRIWIFLTTDLLMVTDWPAVEVKYDSAVDFDSKKVKIDNLCSCTLTY